MITRFLHIFLAAAMLNAMPVLANPDSDVVDVRILPGWRGADGNHVAALQMTLRDGWKTYWRAPGDAGIPPRFIWNRSQNLGDVQITWPTPHKISQNGVTVIGYEGALTLPLTITPARPGRAVKLAGRLEIGVCKEVCVPVTLKVSQDLPQDQTKPDPRIIAALAERPYSASEAGVGRVTCSISPITDGLKLRAEVDVPASGGRELVVIETDNPQVWVAQADTTRQGARLIAETEMYHVEGRAFALNRSGLRITVLGKLHAVEIQGCPAG